MWAERECMGCTAALGASPPADRGALPAMSCSHDRHASCQISPKQDGRAQQVQGEFLGSFEKCLLGGCI